MIDGLTFQTVLSQISLKHLAAGIDNISGRFLKNGADDLAISITHIYNLSIKLSHFRSYIKIVKLKPLNKKGSNTGPKHFRPISLLSIVSKIIRKVVHNQTELSEGKQDFL